MRLKAQLVVVPCVTFAARARLAADSGALTPVELLALRAIGLGLDDVDSLAEVMGLGSRPALDVVYDFWLRGYVVVDTAEAKVRLAGEAARAFSEGALEKLGTAENNLQVVPLLQELVSGSVLPSLGRLRPPGSESALVPTMRGGLNLAGVTRAELLDAVQLQVERQGRKVGRNLSVQEAWVEPDQLLVEASAGATINERRFLPLWADVTQDPDSGRLLFNIVEAPRGVTPPRRQGLERGLALLAERLPDQLFFKRLREELSKAPTADGVSAAEPAIPRLQRAVSGLSDTDPGLVDQRQKQLNELHVEACHELRSLARAQAQIDVVAGYEAHEAEVLRLIEAAQRQLVLGNPWMRPTALLEPPPGMGKSWFDAIEAALGRGVQVFLLWGIAVDSILDSQVANALGDLAARFPGLVFSRRSSTLHAKFVVRDAHEAIVTSYNFLNPPTARDSLELGLVVRGTGDDVAPEAVLDLLEWSRNAFPDYLAAQRMLLLPAELGATEMAAPELPGAPAVPAAEAAAAASAVGRAAISHWESAWKHVASHLVDMADQMGGGVRLVVDREHREALWGALRSAGRRLAVLSDRVSVDVVTDRFIRALKARLDAGTAASFLFRRGGASDRSDGPAGRLVAEAARVPDRCRVREGPSHAKVLVCDDTLVVGSFNFLSYSGEYDSGARERAELSIAVDSGEAVDRVLTVLAEAWPDAFGPLLGLAAPSRSSVLEGLPASLQPLFAQLASSPDPGRVFVERFATADPWSDLAALEEAGCPDELLMVGAAAALAVAPDLGSDPAVRWRGRLALERWKAHDFIGAALLLEPGAPPPALPGWLARLGASVQGGPVDGELVPADLSGEEPGVLASAAALVIVAVLREGRFELLDGLRRIRTSCGEQPRQWIDATIEFVEATYQPIPLPLLRKQAGRAQREADIAAAREEFATALSRAENVGFRFPLGEHTWTRLKMDGYLLGVLRAALDADDPGKAASLLTMISKEETSAESLMDAASYEVRDEHNSRIEDPKRTSCVKRLQKAVEAAQRWAILADTPATTRSDAAVLHSCMVLARGLAGLTPTNGASDEPAAAALAFARKRLAPLLSIGGKP
ncbi:MAG: hypothetical protein D6798_11255 [Deltaproteobacteria bacterium]|nr:MAG: hypothetical protein D6798_11255 [Deltaproteobacteria bacterium]